MASGVLNAIAQVESIAGLAGTAHGRLLLAKLAVLVPILVLASVNRTRILPALSAPSVSVGWRGEPIPLTVIKLRPLRKDGKPYKVPYYEVQVPYYPTMDDRKWASERLAERGWGKPKQDVVIDNHEPSGFRIVYRQWPEGYDPLAKGEKPYQPLMSSRIRSGRWRMTGSGW